MKVSRNISSLSAGRDENSEQTLRQYEDIIKRYESSPHFRANIIAFSGDINESRKNDSGLAKIMVDAAGAESLEGGIYDIVDLAQPSRVGFDVLDFTLLSKLHTLSEGILTLLFTVRED